MEWFAVTDADWNWDTEGACIVLAENAETAVQKALDDWARQEGRLDFDSADLKVARVVTVGSQIIRVEAGSVVKDEFFYSRS